MKRITLFLFLLACWSSQSVAVGDSGIYQYSVALANYISAETGKAPTAYLWIPKECRQVKAVVFAQQNMTEEMFFKSERFQRQMQQLDVALLWVAPWFSQNWDPATGCQQVFDEMIEAIAYQSGHAEISHSPVIPFGHSAQATMPWNFAAWNPNRTLCIISFHGDAPRTNLCGYGTANVEWGRNRNIDGIPGLMVEGEYEWWEARVRPALAFRLMYPQSCISFLCDAGSGHFESMPETMDYISKFIAKSLEYRLKPDGTLKKLNPQDGWLACRYNPDSMPSDGDGAKDDIFQIEQRPAPASWADYQGDRHDAFWYFDSEMALLTEARYAETRNKLPRTIETITPVISGDGKRVTLDVPVGVHVEVISGPLRKVDDGTFLVYPYECGLDNPKRSFTAWLVAVIDGGKKHKRTVLPIQVKLPNKIVK